MDSLLASYASSDDENDSPPPPSKAEQRPPQNDDATISSKRAGLFGSLPPHRSSLFNSIPAPKFQSPNPEPQQDDDVTENPKQKSSISLFSALPPPKSSTSSAGKKVVQFRPPLVTAPKVGVANDLDDEEDEDELEKKRKRSKESISTAASGSSSLSFMLPAPRHSSTLGALGSGRRSMLETDVSSNTTKVVSSESEHTKDQSNVLSAVASGSVVSGNVVDFNDQHNHNYDNSSGIGGEGYAYSGSYGADSVGIDAGVDYGAGSMENVEYSYGNGETAVYSNYEGGYANYDNWSYAPAIPEPSGVAESVVVPMPGKRGRRDDPSQIIEVKQDELIKNRPREDQGKLTGIAFGPSHQPAPSKGKPTKLHKRKHQIGSLYFDMKQKEMELTERRSKGLLTKAQTQGKYGW